MTAILWFLGAYLAGSIPTAYIVAKLLKGIDIREHGSGNPGATNVYRVIGPAAGSFTFLADALKGFLPVFIAQQSGVTTALLIGIGVCALCGHIWTVFLGFKGGKGVATGAGVFLALLPVPAVVALLVFAAVFGISGYVSLGSMIASLSLPVTSFLLHKDITVSIFALIAAAAIIYKHKSNIKKLLSGTEDKTYLKKRKSEGKAI